MESLDNELEISECEINIEDDPRHDGVLRSFIEAYESFPELWNSSHPCYRNKTERHVALDKLKNIYIKMKPGANRATVRRKINSLRSNYRKELKKIVLSMRSGSGTEKIYQPTSWVFYALKFLHSNEQPVNVNVQFNDILLHNENTFVSNPALKKDLTDPLPSTSPKPSIKSLSTPPNKQNEIGPLAKQNEFFSLACKYQGKLKEPQDAVPTIAKVWGEKLATLDAEQRLFAEKAINDVLFEACMGNLNRHSVQINEGS